MLIPDFDLKSLNLGKLNMEIIRVKRVEEAFKILFKK